MSKSTHITVLTPYHLTANIALWLVPAVIYLLSMHLAWPVYGGTGLDLPANLLLWLFVSLWVLGLLWHCRRTQGIRAKKLMLQAICGAALMMLPILWSPLVAWKLNALAKLVGLGALILLFCLLLQVPLNYRQRRFFITLITLAACIESLLTCLQLFFPHWSQHWLHYNFILAQGRPFGGLRQANLLGSFLATGLACASWLVTTSTAQCRSNIPEWIKLAAVGLISMALILTHSRTALLGAALAISLSFFLLRQPFRRCSLCLAIAAGVGIAIFILPRWQPHLVTSPSHQHHSISFQRDVKTTSVSETNDFSLARMRQESRTWRLQMIQGAIIMIKAHPLRGNGLGSFEVMYPQALAWSGHTKLTPLTVTHPHNELLFTWAEGGIIAVAGFGVLAALWLIPFYRRRQWQRYGSLACLSLPIWLHIMTEFPLYLSALHGFTLILLLRIAIPPSLRRLHPLRTRGMIWLPKVVTCAIAISGFCFMTTAWQSQRIILAVERSGFTGQSLSEHLSNPYAQSDRVMFDRAVTNLIHFNKNRNTNELKEFTRRAVFILQAHNDPEMMNSLIQILRVTGYPKSASYWQYRAATAFPTDCRFFFTGGCQ